MDAAWSRNGYMRIPHWLAGRRGLTATAKLLWAILADREGDNSCSWPSLRRLATDLGTGCSTVERAIAMLEAEGLVVIQRRDAKGGRTRSVYHAICAPDSGAQDESACAPETKAQEPTCAPDPVAQRGDTTDDLRPCYGKFAPLIQGVCAPDSGTEPIPREPTKGTKPKRESVEISSARIQEVIDAWNEMAKTNGLATVRGKVSSPRRRMIAAMLRDPDRSAGWREALAVLPTCPFLVGEKGWRADFDWFVRPDGQKRAPIMAILEGKYAATKGVPTDGTRLKAPPGKYAKFDPPAEGGPT